MESYILKTYVQAKHNKIDIGRIDLTPKKTGHKTTTFDDVFSEYFESMNTLHTKNASYSSVQVDKSDPFANLLDLWRPKQIEDEFRHN